MLRPTMDAMILCPDCGTPNPAGNAYCSRCNFPLAAMPAAGGGEAATVPAASGPARPTSAAVAGAEPAPSGDPAVAGGADAPPPMMRPLRARRPRPPSSSAISMLLLTGTVLALAAVFYAVKAYRENNAFSSVEGSNESQQKTAEQAMAALAKDSSNVDARIQLADVFYDTANWSQAIVQYRAAVRRDSSRVTAIVDLGVCYFNLSDSRDAEIMFRLALAREPHHPIALYNLGIVYEKGGDPRAALAFYHQAFGSDPPEAMKQPLMDAIERTAKAAGVKAPPLPGTGHPTGGGQ